MYLDFFRLLRFRFWLPRIWVGESTRWERDVLYFEITQSAVSPSLPLLVDLLISEAHSSNRVQFVPLVVIPFFHVGYPTPLPSTPLLRQAGQLAQSRWKSPERTRPEQHTVYRVVRRDVRPEVGCIPVGVEPELVVVDAHRWATNKNGATNQSRSSKPGQGPNGTAPGRRPFRGVAGTASV